MEREKEKEKMKQKQANDDVYKKIGNIMSIVSNSGINVSYWKKRQQREKLKKEKIKERRRKQKEQGLMNKNESDQLTQEDEEDELSDEDVDEKQQERIRVTTLKNKNGKESDENKDKLKEMKKDSKDEKEEKEEGEMEDNYADFTSLPIHKRAINRYNNQLRSNVYHFLQIKGAKKPKGE
ncbi:MAG: hypothetical protein EZS28_002835 [Streblomastix strix]|uniref:Uncharacterized protein n=1 Tax=Streblomastix strix TaxID=222440 RepID=A0A5J4X4D4_9EUKA|nr:MAG: hypothetical protein EZS28_002835 [Streblomastix strix]